MKNSRMILGAALAAAALALSGCSSSGSGSDPGSGGEGDTLKLWHFESETSAMGIAWAEAIRVFEEETGATVEFEEVPWPGREMAVGWARWLVRA